MRAVAVPGTHPKVGVLRHERLRLEPLGEEHIPGMARAAEGEPDPSGLAQVPTPQTAADYVRDSAGRAGEDYIPFAQVLPDGTVVGHTSYLNLRTWPGTTRLLAVEVGTTWLAARAQGTAVNSVAKLLLFTHAFETWGAARVDVKTDARNARARAGIRAVGARFEGVLCSWQPSQARSEEGRTRDTAMHAITAEEWPQVRAALEQRIARKGAA
jgi:N-acetyltransferase